ncbi:hypothetical protein LJC51_08980 [Lachnospiraceae bacterium OttesenSCG-928-J05]|nr:hypothetical protein [Lachnospiraceae bacterium OttesenSCG-928-J05]
MASRNFDFNKIQRSFMTIKLKEGTLTSGDATLVVKMPMKKTFEKMTAIQNQGTEDMSTDDAMDMIGGIVADILSNNMQKKKITTEDITDNYDIEEMMILLDKFMEFTESIQSDPN